MYGIAHSDRMALLCMLTNTSGGFFVSDLRNTGWRRITGSQEMNAAKIVGIVLIVAGVLGLVYRGFTYTQEDTKAKLGPIEIKVSEEHQVNVPVLISAGALALGVFLVVAGRRK
jgi:hypothetical protein